jgi:hypothetical protein
VAEESALAKFGCIVDAEMVTRWEDDWMDHGTNPQYVALARLFVNDELRALVQFHGTMQRNFYTVTHFESGSSTEVPGQFASLGDAKAAASTKD